MNSSPDPVKSAEMTEALLPHEAAALAPRVLAAQLTALNRQGKISNIVSPINALIVAGLLWGEVPDTALFIWLSLIAIATAVRASVHYLFSRAVRVQRVESANWPLVFITSVCLSSAAWGSGLLIAFPENSFILQAFFIIVSLGMSAGATASFLPYLPVLAAYVLPLNILAAVAMFLTGSMPHIILGALALVFVVALLFLGRSGQRNFSESVRLGVENAYLAQGIEDARYRLGNAIDSMSEGFAAFDAEDRLILANEKLRSLLPALSGGIDANIGYTTFVRQFAQNCLSADAAISPGDWAAEMLRRHRRVHDSVEVKLRANRWLRVEEQNTEDGGTVMIFSDLTHIKAREAAFVESEQRFRDFADAASDWMWELDADLRFKSVSGRYSEVSGQSPERLIGRPIAEAHSLTDDADWAALLDALERRSRFHNLRLVRPDADGRPFQFLISGIPYYAEDGSFQGFRGTGSDITAIVRAEERAREAQMRLFDAIESIPAGFILFDEPGRLTVWNSRAPEYLPGGREMIMAGTHYSQLARLCAESGEIIDAAGREDEWVAEFLDWFRNPVVPREFHFSDGRYVQVLGRRTSDKGTVAILTDISDIRRDQQQLAEKSTMLQATLEGMGEGLIVLDAEYRVLLSNGRLQRLLALPPGLAQLGSSFVDLALQLESGDTGGKQDNAFKAADIMERFEARMPFQFEHCRSNGIVLLGRANLLDTEGWVVVFTDVTAERMAAAALAESEDRYRRVVEAVPDMVAVLIRGRFAFVNTAGADLLGADSPDQLIGRRVLDFVAQGDHDYLRRTQPSDEVGLDVARHEFRAIRVDGSEFEAEASGMEFVYRSDRAVLLVLQDITERKLAETQLVQTSKLAMLGEMAASMAHELNQPLNIIRMAADSSLILAEEGKSDAELERQQFERISAQTERMADIINHMRAFSRREDQSVEAFDPLQSVQAAVSMVQEQFRLDDVIVETELPKKSLLVNGNPVRLEQVILNLLTNARDAVCGNIPAGDGKAEGVRRRIRVGVRVSGENPEESLHNPEVLISISDNGGGIPQEALDRIFDPFFTTKPVGKGTGLGLAIGYNIVSTMGGRLTVANSNAGAVFDIHLPTTESVEGTAAGQIETPKDVARKGV